MPDSATITAADFREAAVLCARRARVGIQTHPVAAFAIAIAAQFGQAPRGVAIAAFALSVLLAVLRYWGARRIQHLETITPSSWRGLVAIPALLANAVWAFATTTILWQTELSTLPMLMLLGSIALVFGCTTSFAPFRHITQLLQLIHLLPPFVVAVTHVGPEWNVTAVLLIAFFLYALRIATAMYDDYWSAQRTRSRLVDARHQAELANSAKDRFLANISHEIRTPLNGIAAPAELLQQTALNTEQQHYLDLITSSTRTLVLLIDDLLDFAKLEAGKFALRTEPFAPQELLEEIIARHRITIERKQLQLVFTAQNLLEDRLLGDAMRIGQIIDNLLTNAVKFTESGTITVAASFAITGDHGTLTVQVADTGCGIAKHIREQIFQPFVQGDHGMSRRHSGSGLGLSICKQLAEQMQGELDFDNNIESVEGRGTRFTLRLQLPVSDQVLAPHIRAPLQQFAGLRVLVAEDNPVNQQVIERQLALLGIRPTLVSNGLEAVRAAQRDSYDLVLLDCQMPELDGYQTARQLRELSGKFTAIPIIALTAHAMTNDARQAFAAGMSDYLAKPVSLETLSRTIARWINHTHD